jgi:hypothetical protein
MIERRTLISSPLKLSKENSVLSSKVNVGEKEVVPRLTTP